MRQVHFFKAKSRIGLANPPYGSHELNIGVEQAPDQILDKQFLANFADSQITSFTFANPEDIEKDQFANVLSANLQRFKDLICHNLQASQTQVIVGGDDSVTFASLNATLEGISPQNLGYIRFDSHADMNLYSQSPTKNFHGMYMRPFLGAFDIAEIAAQVPKKLIATNVLYIGNLNLDPKEAEFFAKLGIKNITGRDILKNPKQVRNFLQNFIAGFSHLHVSFDIDALDKQIAPATGIPAKNGLMMDDVLPLLDAIANHPNLAFDLVEVNPQKPGAQKTIRVAQQILLRVLG